MQSEHKYGYIKRQKVSNTVNLFNEKNCHFNKNMYFSKNIYI